MGVPPVHEIDAGPPVTSVKLTHWVTYNHEIIYHILDMLHPSNEGDIRELTCATLEVGANDRLSGVRLGGVVTGAMLIGRPDGDTDGLRDDTTGDALTTGDTDGIILGFIDGDTDGIILGFIDGAADVDDTGLTLGLCDGLAVGDTLVNTLP